MERLSLLRMRSIYPLVGCLLFLFTTFYYLIYVEKEKIDPLKYWNDHKQNLDLIHFRSLYPSLQKKKENTDSSIEKQEAIGICVNFNFDPDENGNTLASILSFYTMIHKYLVILTPSPSNRLSPRNIKLFSRYNVTSIPVNGDLSNERPFRFTSDVFERKSNVYHMECANTHSGQLQQKCLLICAEFYSIIRWKHSTLRGILYLADDLYFNFAHVFSHPEQFSLDEFWSAPWYQLIDLITGDKGRYGNGWYWWKATPQFWNSFKAFFSSTSNTSDVYQQIFQILYGSNKRLAVGISDLLYIPFADYQLDYFISVAKDIVRYFPSNVFCEVIFSLVVDCTMALSGHWPFQNDRAIFNSSINRLNNLTLIKHMEEQQLIKNGRDPYSFDHHFRQRPCIFNPDGYIWDRNRQNQSLFRNALLNGLLPNIYSLERWPHKCEFVHPVKLSNPNVWSFHLWHQAMQLQIQLFKLYQNKQILLQ